ncbi:MAG: DegT/DnrJ/EryC1/StrS aminotransferase family protein [Magnetococcales bacterium]|nr:DegT/DnrJ/EryC1/StrS aminotransferase family protein [Magnetococcales bacterium]
MSFSSLPAIPLAWADLTREDEQAVCAALARNPWFDAELLMRWEQAWSVLWERPAVAFADPVELIAALKSRLQWPSGSGIAADALLEPVWREACAASWLHLIWHDVDPRTGLIAERGSNLVPVGSGPVQAGFWRHGFGQPTRPSVAWEPPPFLMEEISSVVVPLPGCGWGGVQLVHFDGNGILPGGVGSLLLSNNAALVEDLRRLRRHPPGSAACALGLSLLSRLDLVLARRQHLAARYLAMVPRNLFQLPLSAVHERGWGGFFLAMDDPAYREELQAFLARSGIDAAAPVWYQPDPSAGQLPGVRRFLACALAIPFYPALAEGAQKRVINRIHRWVGRKDAEKKIGDHA